MACKTPAFLTRTLTIPYFPPRLAANHGGDMKSLAALFFLTVVGLPSAQARNYDCSPEHPYCPVHMSCDFTAGMCLWSETFFLGESFFATRQECYDAALAAAQYCQADCNAAGEGISGCYKVCGFAYTAAIKKCDAEL